MRDLKHLIYFENLLQQANNDLVQAACGDGRLALAWNCSYIPEVLLDTDKCFGVRLRAPNCTNPDMATYYMTNRSCPYSKSILERAFEGGYNFISALIGQECCTTMNRMEQYFEYCELIPNEKFFLHVSRHAAAQDRVARGLLPPPDRAKRSSSRSKRSTAWTSRRKSCAKLSSSSTKCAASSRR